MLDKTFENVLFEEKDGVGYITLNNPAQMNAVTAEVTRDLITCIEYCEQEPALRCVVLRGAGGNFCAGGNVKAMKERLDKGINGGHPHRRRVDYAAQDHFQAYHCVDRGGRCRRGVQHGDGM